MTLPMLYPVITYLVLAGSRHCRQEGDHPRPHAVSASRAPTRLNILGLDQTVQQLLSGCYIFVAAVREALRRAGLDPS